MNRSTLRIGGLALVSLLGQPALGSQRGTCDEFSELRMTLEQNATDGDTEVVVFAKGQDAGLARLVITAPNGRPIATFVGSPHGIGLREFNLESAEPPDLDRVLRSFPEGDYRFKGWTVEGACLQGTAPLSHQLAPAAAQLTPEEDQVVPIDQVVLSWESIPGVELYVIELNNETAGTEYTLQILPPTTSVAIPAHLLQADSEYQFVVGAKMPDGNITNVELTFFTAP